MHCYAIFIDPQPAGATCGVCDRVSDPKDCSVDQECQPTEVGYIYVFHQIRT